MGLVLVFVVRILHGDWLIRLGEKRPDRALKHLAAMLIPGRSSRYWLLLLQNLFAKALSTFDYR